jgi:hypothetical protein
MGYGVTGIDQNMVGLPYRPFLDWTGKSGNFFEFSVMFIWAFSHCSSGLGLLSFFF